MDEVFCRVLTAEGLELGRRAEVLKESEQVERVTEYVIRIS